MANDEQTKVKSRVIFIGTYIKGASYLTWVFPSVQYFVTLKEGNGLSNMDTSHIHLHSHIIQAYYTTSKMHVVLLKLLSAGDKPQE